MLSMQFFQLLTNMNINFQFNYYRKLATCSADKTIKLWNFDNKKNEKKNNE